MLKHYIILVLLLAKMLIPIEGKAQTTKPDFQISGKIISKINEEIPFANVVLYKSIDSTLLRGTTSDIDGNFTINVNPGKYYLKISFLSYHTKTIGNVNLSNESIELNTIVLEPNVNQLEEVEISAERNQMELKLDKRIFNVGKDLSNAGSNAAEILDNIPSVAVDIDGNVSLRGSENVRVLIDGKPSSITGGSTADVLRQFQGSMIERVEVVTNPSARYDAEGEVGIINIVLKKEEKKGINGSIESVVGYPDNYRLSFNLNYRQKMVNLFTSYGIGYNKSPGGGVNYQRFSNPDTSYLYESESERIRSGLNHNARLGADFFLNDKNTITVAGLYRYSDEYNTAKYKYLDLYSNGELYRQINRNDYETEIGDTKEASINYRKTFDKKDELFTFDLQWSESDDLEKSDIDEYNHLLKTEKIQKSSNVEANRTYLAQTDYAKPIGKNGLFELGAKATARTIENTFQVKQEDQNKVLQILPNYNNDFLFLENIYAAYMMFGNKIKGFNYQFGLRTEHADISTELKLTNQKNKWTYTNLFPSAHFSYEFENKNSVQLSYSRRINRPHFRHLLPFQTFSDQRNLWKGNPNLQPEFTDAYELGFLKYYKKGSLFSSLYYRHRTGVINRIVVTDNLGYSQMFPVNLTTEDNVGFEFNGNYKFNKKNNLNTSFNFYRSIAKGSYQGINLDNDIYTWSNRTTYKMEILPKVDFQFSGRYMAPQKTSQGFRKALYTFDLSASKDVLKGKGTLVASVRDVLNSRKRRSTTETDYLYSESEFQWRSRQFLLTFTYRIKEMKKRNGKPDGSFDGGGDDF
ncbi:MAG: TonB-dependent receptor [Bacteroidetes bacterium]|nr:MAG: TonB-dependent receptor [Bacteroidota bacterium]MBL1144697.1 TonB-dependent receptor [Bacteroidota bacterium]NOG57491.1 TonB-dependent receptor [Bacteroidota bacterium]